MFPWWFIFALGFASGVGASVWVVYIQTGRRYRRGLR